MAGRRRLKWIWTAAAVLAGCSSPVEYDAGPAKPGVLQLLNYVSTVSGPDTTVLWSRKPEGNVLTAPQPILAPDTVQAGNPFDVVVSTIGLDGCWRAGGETKDVRDGVVELAPFDVHSGASICTDIVQYLQHHVVLELPAPGVWAIRVQGRRVRFGNRAWEEPVVAEKLVVAR